jgi:predicted SprT family Zn-dependent metalloprotease
MRAFLDDQVVEIGRAHLVSLARAWKHPRVSRLEIVVNPRFKSTIARWLAPSNVLEINPAAEARGGPALREIISHEAAHVVV